MLSVISSATGAAFKKVILRDDNYEVHIRTWIDQNDEDAPLITFKPIGDIAYLPDIVFANNEFILSFSTIMSVEIKDANRVVSAIKAAINTCDEVRKFIKKDKV